MRVALPPRTFDHDAFVHDTDEEFVSTLVPLLHAALQRGEATAAVVSAPKAALLAATLGSAASRVEFVSAETWYRHPVSTISAYEARLKSAAPGQRTFLIGEVQFGEDPADWTAWTRYEALLNSALSPYDAWVVCPYDRRWLPANVVEAAARTHPHVVDGAGRNASGAYTDPAFTVSSLPPTVNVPARPADFEVRLSGSLHAARQLLSRVLASGGFDRERSDELILAINEIATNALTHGRGAAALELWMDHTGFTCVVRDQGRGAGPLVGYKPPPLGATSGYGLWLSRRIFDRVDTVADGDGFRVALFASATMQPAPSRA